MERRRGINEHKVGVLAGYYATVQSGSCVWTRPAAGTSTCTLPTPISSQCDVAVSGMIDCKAIMK